MGLAMTKVIDRAEMAAAFAEAAEIAKNGTQEERAGRMQPVGPVTALRQRMGLSRKEFAERYHIPRAMLDDWERGTVEPDAVAKALLQLIDASPDTVAKLLEGSPAAAAE
jgi:putative transcriptional regulator